MILIWLSLESVQGCAICNGSLHAKICVSWRQLHLNTHLHLPSSLCIHYFHLTAAKVQADDAKMHWYYWGWSLLQLRMILSNTWLSCPDVQIVRYTHTCHYTTTSPTTCCLQNQFLDYIHLKLDWSSSWSFAQCVLCVACFFMKMSDMHQASALLHI